MEKQKKPSRREQVKAIKARFDPVKFVLLRERWGAKVFDRRYPRPLMVGIHQRIINELKGCDIPYWYYLQELKAYTSRPEYYRCLQAGHTRYSLGGLGVGHVTEAEAAQALLKICESNRDAFMAKHPGHTPFDDLMMYTDEKVLKRQRQRNLERNKKKRQKERLNDPVKHMPPDMGGYECYAQE